MNISRMVVIVLVSVAWAGPVGAEPPAFQEFPGAEEDEKRELMVDQAEQRDAVLEEARLHEQNKHYDEAIKAYRRLLIHDRGQPDILTRIASCYVRQDDYVNAIISYRETLRYEPSLPEARFGLGAAYVRTGELPLAEAQYVKLLPLDAQKAAELKRLIEEAGGTVPAVELLPSASTAPPRDAAEESADGALSPASEQAPLVGAGPEETLPEADREQP